MTRGIYTAATGMQAEELAQQVVAQNLANASTTGYKQDVPTFQSYLENLVASAGSDGSTEPIGTLGQGTELNRIATDLSPGAMQHTGNPLDVALGSSAYLAVRGHDGQTYYSRDGALTLDSHGTLVQAGSGLAVVGAGGSEIHAGKGANIAIGPDGGITSDNKIVGSLALVSITNRDAPVKVGDNLLTLPGRASAISPSDINGLVSSGYLEASNVSVVRQMVTMIAGLRSYEANQKVLQQQDELQGKAVADVGRTQ